LDKTTKRAQKLQRQLERNPDTNLAQSPPTVIHCACVIHGETYSWNYVERLYNMLDRNLSADIVLHVYTEAHRSVPAPMIKHELTDWGISGPRKSWWYKIQLFNSMHYSGPLLYFDLDTVIVDNIDWICNLPLRYFWTLKDFKYLWRPSHQGINSSVMWWDTRSFDHVWKNFRVKDLDRIVKQYHGDQDYLTQEISNKNLRFIDSERVKSWRWQCLHGGYNFQQRTYQNPNSGTQISKQTSVLIFHGKPKPDQITDPAVLCHWR
jgi:hypothetical protein